MNMTTNRKVTVTVSGIPLPDDDQLAHAHCEWVGGNDGTIVIGSAPYVTHACEKVAMYIVNVQDSDDDEDHAPLKVCEGHVSEASHVGA